MPLTYIRQTESMLLLIIAFMTSDALPKELFMCQTKTFNGESPFKSRGKWLTISLFLPRAQQLYQLDFFIINCLKS